jgi:hypothetical protein
MLNLLSERVEEARINSGGISISGSNLRATFRKSSVRSDRQYICEPDRCNDGTTHKKVLYTVDENGNVLEDKGCSNVRCEIGGGDWRVPAI